MIHDKKLKEIHNDSEKLQAFLESNKIQPYEAILFSARLMKWDVVVHRSEMDNSILGVSAGDSIFIDAIFEGEKEN